MQALICFCVKSGLVHTTIDKHKNTTTHKHNTRFLHCTHSELIARCNKMKHAKKTRKQKHEQV